MVKMRLVTTTICVFVLILIYSCGKTMPSGFWQDFKAEYLKDNISDQGPRGGHTAIHWKAENLNVFQSADVTAYARKNGWDLVDSIAIDTNMLNQWYNIKRPIFPLSHEDFDLSASSNYSTYEDFPRWINTKSTVYRFKTSWVFIEPGTDETNNINGFVLLNNDGSEMSVYNVWGE
jgi:hypothetical protein